MTTDLKDVPCEVCRGSGKTYLEHDDGSLSERTCPYCKGAKNTLWLGEKRKVRAAKVEWVKIAIIGYVMALIYTNSWPRWSWGAAVDGVVAWQLFVLHCAAWVLFLVGCAWWYTHPKPSKRRRRPNPLTTNREKLMGGAVLGGALLKAEWEHRNRGR